MFAHFHNPLIPPSPSFNLVYEFLFCYFWLVTPLLSSILLISPIITYLLLLLDFLIYIFSCLQENKNM